MIFKKECKAYEKASKKIYCELNDSLKECRNIMVDLSKDIGIYQTELKVLCSEVNDLNVYKDYLEKKEQNKALTRQLIEAEKYYKYEKQKLMFKLNELAESISGI